MTVPAYRSVHTGKQLMVWLVIRSLALVTFITLCLLAARRGEWHFAVMSGIFAFAMLLHLIELLQAVARIERTDLPR